MKKVRKILTAAVAAGMAAAMAGTAWAGEWKQDDKGWWYETENGNYKSAVGTWKSSNGKTITITSDGQLDFWGYTYPIDKVSPNQYVSGIYTLTYVDSSPVGNTPIQLCPKGVSDASNAGDNSKDRILATNGVPSEESYFYRVD